MPLTALQALRRIIEEANQRSGKCFTPGATIDGAEGKLFREEIRISPSGERLEILTVDGLQGLGAALNHHACVISFGSKSYAENE